MITYPQNIKKERGGGRPKETKGWPPEEGDKTPDAKSDTNIRSSGDPNGRFESERQRPSENPYPRR